MITRKTLAEDMTGIETILLDLEDVTHPGYRIKRLYWQYAVAYGTFLNT